MNLDFQPLGRVLLLFGGWLLAIGLALLWLPKVPWLGRLPGDIAIRRDGFSLYFPFTSGLVLSALLSVVAWLIGRFHR